MDYSLNRSHHLLNKEPHGSHHFLGGYVTEGEDATEVVTTSLCNASLHLLPHSLGRTCNDDLVFFQGIEVGDEIQAVRARLGPKEVYVPEPGCKGRSRILLSLTVCRCHINMPDKTKSGYLGMGIQVLRLISILLPDLLVIVEEGPNLRRRVEDASTGWLKSIGSKIGTQLLILVG